MAKLSSYFDLQPKQKIAMQYIGKGYRIFFGGARGGGKASSLDAKIFTTFGTKTIRDIKIGDLVSNPDGGTSKVIWLHPIEKRELYKVSFVDGASTEVSGEHLWKIWITNKTSKRNGIRSRNYKLMTTYQMINHLQKTNKTNNNLCVPLTEPVAFTRSTRNEKLDPYLLGLLLGDGCITGTATVQITTQDAEIANAFYERALYYEYKIREKLVNNVRILFFNNNKRMIDLLKMYGLYGTRSNNKFIPDVYKLAPIEERFEIVRGLMDTDGYVDARGHLSYTTVSKQLADDFQWMVRSLGAKATITTSNKSYRDANGDKVQCQLAYTVYFNSNHNDKFVKLQRKYLRCKGKQFNGGYTLHREISSIESVGMKECRCITVDNPNGLYVTDDFIVTHNSFLALASAVVCAIRYPGIKIMVIRKTYPELEEVFITPLRNKYPSAVFKYNYQDQKKVAVFKNKSRIIFKAIETEKDANKAQGVEFQLLIIDEAPNFDEDLIYKLLGSLRNSDISNFTPTLLMTGNPGGSSDKYFKTRFIRPDHSQWEPGELTFKDKYVFVESRVADNKHLGEDYINTLNSLSETLREAWLNGNWDVFEGAFFENWSQDKMVVEPFEIPKDWYRVAGFDLGFTKKHPTVCLWLAQNPETLDIYVYKEYSAFGSVERYVSDIKSMTIDEQFILFVDPSMFTNNQRYEYDESPGKMIQNSGLAALPANNDRVNGWRIVKAWFNRKLFIFDTCPGLISTIPTLRYTPYGRGKKEDLDTKMADDYVDALRYALISGFGYPMVNPEDALTKQAKIFIDKSIKQDKHIRHDDWVDSQTLMNNAIY